MSNPSIHAIRPRSPVRPPAAASAQQASQPVHRITFILCCIYLIAGLTNEISTHVLGSKAYLPLVAAVTLPIATLASGNALRFLKHPAGKAAAALLLPLLGSCLLSVWLGGSLESFKEYVIRSFCYFVYIPAAALTLRNCRSLFLTCALGLCFVLISCTLFGGADRTGRFIVEDSMFFSNANDLALQLALSCFITAYLLMGERGLLRIAGVAMIALAAYYFVKTGSRGTLLGVLATALVAVLYSRRRMQFLALSIPAALILLLLMPDNVKKRFFDIAISVNTSDLREEVDDEATASQLERTRLLWTAVDLAIRNPIFGVGVGQFGEVAQNEAKKQARRQAYLNPHNTYAQIASEAGITSLVLYTLVVLFSIRSNLHLYKLTRNSSDPEATLACNMAFALYLATICYAVSTFFNHVAFRSFLPQLGGMSIALWMASEPVLRRIRPAQPAIPARTRPVSRPPALTRAH